MRLNPIAVLALSLSLSFVLTGTAEAQSRRRAVGPPATSAPVVFVDDDFSLGARGWQTAFADYSPLTALPLFEFDAGIRPLPPEINPARSGMYFRGHNRSDDLFMFMTKKLTRADGIEPNRPYEVSFRITVDSNVGTGCFGIGGSPGGAVVVKAGASQDEPRVTLDDHQVFRVTVDKGNQTVGGPGGSVVGNIENGTTSCDGAGSYVRLVRAHRHPFTVTSNAAGELWLVIGTDSGFEGLTTLYYESVSATLTPLPRPLTLLNDSAASR
jgi:hypothetical protein